MKHYGMPQGKTKTNKQTNKTVKFLTPDQESSNFFSKGPTQYFRLCGHLISVATMQLCHSGMKAAKGNMETNESTCKSLVTKTSLQNFIYKSRSEFDPILGDPHNLEVLGCPQRPLSSQPLCYEAMHMPRKITFLGGSG